MLILPEQKHVEDETFKTFKKMCREESSINDCGVELSDEFLNAYIIGKNGDLKKAFKALKLYISLRKGKYRDFFQTVIPSRCRYFLDIPKFEAFFKNRDTHGHLVGFFKLSLIDFNVVDIDDIFRSLVVASEELITSKDIMSHGLLAIIDCRGLSLHHARVITPSRIQFLFNIFVGSLPIKYKGFHLLYDNPIFYPILKLFKAFAPRKIRERIFVHGSDVNSLHITIPPSILPKWLGGELDVEECYDFEIEERAYAREEHYKRIALKW